MGQLLCSQAEFQNPEDFPLQVSPRTSTRGGILGCNNADESLMGQKAYVMHQRELILKYKQQISENISRQQLSGVRSPRSGQLAIAKPRKLRLGYHKYFEGSAAEETAAELTSS